MLLREVFSYSCLNVQAEAVVPLSGQVDKVGEKVQGSENGHTKSAECTMHLQNTDRTNCNTPSQTHSSLLETPDPKSSRDKTATRRLAWRQNEQSTKRLSSCEPASAARR